MQIVVSLTRGHRPSLVKPSQRASYHTVLTGFLLLAQFVRSTQLSLRDLSGCPRFSRHDLQEGTGQNRKTPCFNDIIWRAFDAAGIPAVKEPSGLDRQDGKRPHGLT